MLVPFPFTDLTGQKRRPALVVSPDGFDRQDFVLCAITSRLSPRLLAWDVALNPEDVEGGVLPRASVIKGGKLFTMHRRLIVGRFAAAREQKVQEVLGVLRRLFEA